MQVCARQGKTVAKLASQGHSMQAFGEVIGSFGGPIGAFR